MQRAATTGMPKLSALAERCYTLLQQVPRGKVTTYKRLAQALGTRGYRAVGQILNRNPYAPQVPCHRVVATDGALRGYAHGLRRKAALLTAEGVAIERGRIADLDGYLHNFKSS